MTDQVQADTIDGNAHPGLDLIKDLRVHDGEQCFGEILRHIVYFAQVIESKMEMVRGVRCEHGSWRNREAQTLWIRATVQMLDAITIINIIMP